TAPRAPPTRLVGGGGPPNDEITRSPPVARQPDPRAGEHPVAPWGCAPAVPCPGANRQRRATPRRPGLPPPQPPLPHGAHPAGALPICARSRTVAPQTYILTSPGSIGSNGSLRRVSEL